MTTISRNDIKVVPVDQCVPFSRNPRRGDLEAIKESLTANGQFKPIVVRAVNAGEQEAYEILAGNHTWNAAKDLGWPKIAVVIVEADDDRAKKILIADNRTSDLGTYDDQELTALLKELDDLTGTAWAPDDLLELRRLTGDLAAAQTDALDAALGGPPDHQEPDNPPRNAGDEYRFNVLFACTADERTTLQNALNHIKRTRGIVTSNEAIIVLAEIYAADHMQDEEGEAEAA